MAKANLNKRMNTPQCNCEKYRTALEFYADEDNNKDIRWEFGGKGFSKVQDDKGKIAREALKEVAK